MKLPFYKYQGAGNDFVMVDQREQSWIARDDRERIERLCDRRFGIGADGLILLENHADHDFEMVYFNADGRPSSMCGNGGRCIVAFAYDLGIIERDCTFLAVDGPHRAIRRADGWVELEMIDVSSVECGDDYYYLNTGSPHYVTFRDSLDSVDVVGEGRRIRYNDRFRTEGTNVNFVSTETDGGIAVGTYERGVEDETLACGTGVTAAALAHYLRADGGATTVPIRAKGGALEVRFRPLPNGGFADIWLVGPAERVFTGEISLIKK